MPPRASYVIPYRSKLNRDRGFDLVLQWLSEQPDIEVIVVEQAAKPCGDLRCPPRLKGRWHRVFAPNSGTYNKSWALNLGYKHSTASVVMFGDADCLLEAPALWRAIAKIESGVEAVSPYHRIVDLTSDESNTLALKQIIDLKPQREGRTGISFAGGIVGFGHQAYEQLGGFDERFVGWGGEDDALSLYKIPRLLERFITMEATALHVWHERDHQDGQGHPLYEHNLTILNEFKRYSLDELKSVCEVTKKTGGSLEKYKANGQRGSFDDFAKALGERESSSRYDVVNRFGYLGKYQFGMARLSQLGLAQPKIANPGDGNEDYQWIPEWSEARFLSESSTQELLFARHINEIVARLGAPRYASQLGQTHGGITLSLSGMVAGIHLLGEGGLKSFIEGGDPSDALDTPISNYIEEFGHYTVDEGLCRLGLGTRSLSPVEVAS